MWSQRNQCFNSNENIIIVIVISFIQYHYDVWTELFNCLTTFFLLWIFGLHWCMNSKNILVICTCMFVMFNASSWVCCILHMLYVAAIFLQHDSVGSADVSGGIQAVNWESDCLISCATVSGYPAMRSQSEGESSWQSAVTLLCAVSLKVSRHDSQLLPCYAQSVWRWACGVRGAQPLNGG